jgi:hypothetical protein
MTVSSAVARALFTVAMLLILPASAFAQQFGVKAGANFASLTPEEDEDPETSRRIGLVAGGWIRTPSSGRLSFQAEGLFSEKGVVFDAVPPFLPSSIDIRLRYIEIPLLARFDFGAPSSTTRVFVVGGAAPEFKLSARARTEIEGVEDTADLDNAVETIGLGLSGGVGVEFGRVVLEARYSHGVVNINTDDNDPNDRIRNRVFSVTAGWRLY